MIKLFFLGFLTACTTLISKIDGPIIKEDQTLQRKDVDLASYCPVDRKFRYHVVGTAISAEEAFLEEIKRSEGLDFMDHLALWSLAQFSLRPDQSSPTARLQIIVKLRGKGQYLDFFSEDARDQYPYLYGLQWILKKFKKNRSLEFYAQWLDRSLNSKLKVGKDLANFLSKNKDLLKANKGLAPFYFRGAEVLSENESVPVLSYSALVREFRKKESQQKIVVNTSLTRFVTESGQSGSCNYDFNLYNNSIFLIDKETPVANLFGLSEDKAAFLASSSQKLPALDSLHGQPVFNGVSKIRSSAVCVMENADRELWTFSNQSRDPGQHLFHLIRYGLPRSQTVQEIDKLLRHSRHLFLSDPTRLIIESSRTKKAQVENLLKLNLPIYNSDSLGNIWAFVQNRDYSRFVVDERNPGSFVCQ